MDKYQEDEGMENMVEKYSRFQIQAPAQASNEQDASKKGVVVSQNCAYAMNKQVLNKVIGSDRSNWGTWGPYPGQSQKSFFNFSHHLSCPC